MLPSFLLPSSSLPTYLFLKMNPSSRQFEICLPAVWWCVSHLPNCLIKKKKKVNNAVTRSGSEVMQKGCCLNMTKETFAKRCHQILDVRCEHPPETHRLMFTKTQLLPSLRRRKQQMDKSSRWIQRISSVSGQNDRRMCVWPWIGPTDSQIVTQQPDELSSQVNFTQTHTPVLTGVNPPLRAVRWCSPLWLFNADLRLLSFFVFRSSPPARLIISLSLHCCLCN